MNTNSFGHWTSQSHLVRIFILGFLVLILQIPINSVKSLMFERQATESAALHEVQQKWGYEQRIIGPLLVIPYHKKYQWQDASTGATQTKIETKRAVFLPDEFESSSKLVNETRYRGIFEVPLYQASVDLSGSFSKPNFGQWDIKEDDVLWDKARLVVLASDARAIQKQARIRWNGADYYFEPGTDEVTSNREGYHVDLTDINDTTGKIDFSIRLILNGSKGLYLAPIGKDSAITVSASWPDPSFQGNWLPTTRKVHQNGFNAQWRIPYLGRNFPQQTREFSSIANNIANSLVGVDFITPVDNYRMAERSIKYELLFLLLTFVVIWLIEVVGKLRVHVVQYLFIGAGLCLFYLLELSLSEHLGFYWAYAVATFAIVSMVSAYSYFILQSGKRAAIMGIVLTGLYAYLFTLLQDQNYALLIGSISLFFMLSAVMYITRNIDWYKLTPLPLPKSETAEQS
jgi:inner membrane protein